MQRRAESIPLDHVDTFHGDPAGVGKGRDEQDWWPSPAVDDVAHGEVLLEHVRAERAVTPKYESGQARGRGRRGRVRNDCLGAFGRIRARVRQQMHRLCSARSLRDQLCAPLEKYRRVGHGLGARRVIVQDSKCHKVDCMTETRELRAGPLTVRLEGIDLRYVRFGDVEVVRRLFAAIRDDAWGTVPPQVYGLEIEDGEDSFRIAFEASHEQGGLRFRWHGELTGSADGTLDCRLDGTAETDFDYNRIGFCVLHPMENAGRPYRTRTEAGKLPAEIGPQRLEDGKLWPLFPSYDLLEIEVSDGVWARFEFEGDLFEMEDQRNWTDASFKTYSTPLTLGVPHHAKAEQKIAQTVRLTVSGDAQTGEHEGPVRIHIGDMAAPALPRIGLGMSSNGRDLTEREEDLVGEVRPDHLRVDLHIGRDGWREELERAGRQAVRLAAGLEVALFLGDDPGAELEALAGAIPLAQARLDRFLVFKEDALVADAHWAWVARDRLGAAARSAPFAAGTDNWFVEINRHRLDLDGADGVAYSICATVHADDDTSVRETPAAQGETVRSARTLAGDRAIFVGPVTIRPRSWPHGDIEQDPTRLPAQVDARQCTLFGAAWTVASLKHLAEAGPASITYFETVGWRGVLEREEGPALPEKFPSRPGRPFPLYHVLADVGEWREFVRVREARSSASLDVVALAVEDDVGIHLLIANLTQRPQRVQIRGLETDDLSLRMLDEQTAEEAGADPAAFRRRREKSGPELDLGPWAVARLDP
jgi:D-apionolactonase